MAKRGINIYKRKDGRWEGRYIQGRKISGDAKYGYVYGHSYSECREKLKSAEVQVKSPPKCKCTLTVKELFSLLLRDKAGEVKKSTLARYSFLINRHILPSLSDMPVSKLTADRLQSFLDEKRKNGSLRGGALSAKSVRDICVLIRSALRMASGTFASMQEPPHIKLPPCRQRKIQVFSDGEVQRIAAHAVAAPTPGSLGILLGLNTGLRLGELCALRWSDVDFFSGTLRVERTVQRINYDGSTHLLLQSPKSENSMRSVPVPADMLALLKKKAAGTAPEAYILTGRVDKPMEPRTCQRGFHALLKSCGVKDRNFHTIRHTYATRCIDHGVDIKSLSEMLGHADIQTTLRLYVHSSMEHKQSVIQKISFLPSIA